MKIEITDKSEAATLILEGLIAQGRIGRGVRVHVRIENVTVLALDGTPPTLVIETMPDEGELQ